MKWKGYPEYKDSVGEWLGEVPKGWDIKRLKTSAIYRVSNVDKISKENEIAVRLCNYTDVYYNEDINPNMNLLETTATKEEIDRFGLYQEDIIVTKDSEDWRDIAIPAHVSATESDIVCGYHLAIIRTDKTKLLGRYAFRSLQSKVVNHQFQLAATGVTRYGLPKASIGEAVILIPPIDEQTAIVNFLDHKTNHLDTLIAKKQALIERLKEKRTALISRTVTRGLPADVAREFGLEPHTRFKDSGIEWLSKIPEAWKILPVKYLCKKIVDCKNRTPEYFNDGEYLVVRTTDVKEGVLHYRQMLRTNLANYTIWTQRGAPKADDVLFTREAPAGESSIFNGSEKICLGQRMMYFRLNKKKLLPAFLFYWIYSDVSRSYIHSSSGGSTVTHLRVGQVLNFPVVEVPIVEQTAIATYLDRETAKIDKLIEKIQTAIERLQEYRTALITAAVTGKIDVRDWTPKKEAA